MKPDSLWRHRDFTLLWSGQALSGLGGSMAGLAYPLITLAITGSAVLAGVVGTVALATTVLVGIPAGVLVDRVDRRMLMLACDAVRLVAFAVLSHSCSRVTGRSLSSSWWPSWRHCAIRRTRTPR